MTKIKQNKTKQLKISILILSVTCFLLAVGLTISLIFNMKQKEKIEKMDTILDMFCYYSGDASTCKGIDLLMEMDLNDLRNGRFGNLRNYMNY